MATENLVTFDDVRPILAAIRERGIRIDPLYAGECRQLFGNRGTRLQYQRKDGLTIDGVAELLLDRGFVSRPISTVECLTLLETLLAPAVKRLGGAAPTRSEIDAQAKRARAMRLRKFVCDDCGQIARGTRNSSLICGLCFEMDAEIRMMRRVDPLPEEILAVA